MTLAFRESYGISTLVYRLFNVYGPKQNPDSLYAAVIPKWIFAAFKGEPLIVYGDGGKKETSLLLTMSFRFYLVQSEKNTMQTIQLIWHLGIL